MCRLSKNLKISWKSIAWIRMSLSQWNCQIMIFETMKIVMPVRSICRLICQILFLKKSFKITRNSFSVDTWHWFLVIFHPTVKLALEIAPKSSTDSCYKQTVASIFIAQSKTTPNGRDGSWFVSIPTTEKKLTHFGIKTWSIYFSQMLHRIMASV